MAVVYDRAGNTVSKTLSGACSKLSTGNCINGYQTTKYKCPSGYIYSHTNSCSSSTTTSRYTGGGYTTTTKSTTSSGSSDPCHCASICGVCSKYTGEAQKSCYSSCTSDANSCYRCCGQYNDCA